MKRVCSLLCSRHFYCCQCLHFFFSLCQIDNATVILDEEPDVGSGMAAALKLAMSKGYLEKEEKKRIVISKSAQELQAQRYTIEDKAAYNYFVFCLYDIQLFLFYFVISARTTNIQEEIVLMARL